MKEIRIHGRGGQGSVVTAELFAIAAFEDGKYSQAFPYLGGGGERRGAPVQAFARISDKPIRLRSKIHYPDYIIVQDLTLLDNVNVFEGLKPGGLVLINTEKKPDNNKIPKDINIKTIPATKIALEFLGLPIMNTAIMGAFAAASGEFKLDSIVKAIKNRFPGELGEKNAMAAKAAYDTVLNTN
ncbi:pyruvate ferredoxin oxidoreductase subunit gamma [Thermoanaerobacteraceae bacterium SP2]|nr:pyruvate ferredoxin oxidoreductase subunit gamma [Thermoanaerobacteraceae bacterium SP2]